MKKVLYIGAGAPWIGGAGYLVRQRMFLRALAEVAELHLALFHLPDGAEASRPDFVRSVIRLLPVQSAPDGRLRRFIGDLTSALPRVFRTRGYDAVRALIKSIEPSFDAVFSFRIDFAHFAGVLGHPRLLLDIDDPEHLRWRRRLAVTCPGGTDWRSRRDVDKLARFEKRAARGALASFVCQEHDRVAFDPLPIVVPNCVDVPAVCPSRNAGKPKIVYVGNFALGSANDDGLRWMFDEVWPLVRADMPDCEFHIVGRLAGELEARVRNTAGVVAGGFVKDLGQAMSQASLSIAPIRFGTGTRIKILESFAFGCPVVSTTLGAEGIDAVPGKEILIGDTSAAFAGRCITLLRDPAMQAGIAAAAYRLVAARYNEHGRRQELSALLAGLLDRCSAAPSGAALPGVQRSPAERMVVL